MIWAHVFVKTLREAARRPLYLATLLGIPFLLMVSLGSALDGEPTVAPSQATGSGDALAAEDRAGATRQALGDGRILWVLGDGTRVTTDPATTVSAASTPPTTLAPTAGGATTHTGTTSSTSSPWWSEPASTSDTDHERGWWAPWRDRRG